MSKQIEKKIVRRPEDVSPIETIDTADVQPILNTSGTWLDFFGGSKMDDDFLSERFQPILSAAHRS